MQTENGETPEGEETFGWNNLTAIRALGNCSNYLWRQLVDQMTRSTFVSKEKISIFFFFLEFFPHDKRRGSGKARKKFSSRDILKRNFNDIFEK